MKTKIKCISIFVMLMLVVAQLSPCASAVSGGSDEEYIIEGSEQSERIDELFSQRLSLEHDYENNREQIEEIDRQLMALGVEFLETEEVSDMLGEEGIAPAWLPQSTSSVRWTSRNAVTTYRGYQFDVQVLEGVPISATSPLIKDHGTVDHEADGITAGVTKVILSLIAGTAVDYFGENLGRGLTVLDLMRIASDTMQNSISTSTVLNNVNCVAMISFTAHMRYIYVKPHDAPEEEYQGLYYIGNSVSSKITTVTAIHPLVDGEIVTEHNIKAEVHSTMQSKYYDDFSHAAAAYWDYNYNNNAGFKQDYTNYTVNLTILNSTDLYYLPWASHPNITG